MVVELGDQHVGEEACAGHAAGDRAAGGRHLDHLLAAAAGLLRASDLDDLELCRDHLDDLTHVFTHEAQVAPAIRAGATGIEFLAFARRVRRDTRTPGRTQLGAGVGRSGLLVRIVLAARHEALLRDGDVHIFERELELRDLAQDLLGGLSGSVPTGTWAEPFRLMGCTGSSPSAPSTYEGSVLEDPTCGGSYRPRRRP